MNQPLNLPPLTVKGRVEAVAAKLADINVDALVVTNLTNIRWCSGFTGSAGTLVISTDQAILITDSRYTEQAPVQTQAAGASSEVRINSQFVAAVAEAVGNASVVALEADHISWANQRRLEDSLSATLVETSAIIAELRSVKDPAELARIETAAKIVDAVLGECCGHFMRGVSELEIARMLEDGMRLAGANGPAYETIVASGANSALPHKTPSPKRLFDGDLLVVDAGALVDGYRSDMTRTFMVGEPDERALELYELVRTSQAAGVAAVRPGVAAGEIDKVCREVITEAGYGDAFTHSTGHGVGLNIHELPAIRRNNQAELLAGQVITVEPGVYFSGYGGVRVEDTVVVTEDGSRPLTQFSKETSWQ